MIDAGEFYKWLKIFGLSSGGGGPPVQIISDPTTLTSNALGQTYLVIGGPFGITLPSPTAGINQSITLMFEPAVFGNLFNVVIPGGGNINYGANESVTFFTNGVYWAFTDQFLAPVQRTDVLTIAQAGGAVLWNTVQEDVGTGFGYDVSTGIYTPKYPGRYSIYAQVLPLASPTTQTLTVQRNSVIVAQTVFGSGIQTIPVTKNEYFNGSTDNFKISWTQTGTATTIGNGGVTQNYIIMTRNGNI